MRDIKEIYNSISQHLFDLSSKKGTKETCLNILQDYDEFVELLKIQWINQSSYFGPFFMNLKFRANFIGKEIARLVLTDDGIILESNPLVLFTYSIPEIYYIFCEVVEHLILNHPYENRVTNPTNDPIIQKRLDQAMDASINDRLHKEISEGRLPLVKPIKAETTSVTLAIRYHLKNIRTCESWLYYYNLLKDIPDDQIRDGNPLMKTNAANNLCAKLIQDAKSILSTKNKNQDAEISPNKNSPSSTGKNSKPTSNQTQNNQENQPSLEKPTPSENDQNYLDIDRLGKDLFHQWTDDPNFPTDMMKSLTQEFIKITIDKRSKNRGLYSAQFYSDIQNYEDKPVLDWRKILKNYVGLIPDGTVATRTRLNRRQPLRFDISGRKPNRTINIVVAIDTSSSMSDESIEKIMNEIFDIVGKRKKKITIIECDAIVQRIYEVKKKKDVKPKVWGRGGTRYTPVIKYINSHPRFRSSLLIYFTDGFGSLSIPKPKTYRNLWVVLDDVSCLSLEEPYGKVIALKAEGRGEIKNINEFIG